MFHCILLAFFSRINKCAQCDWSQRCAVNKIERKPYSAHESGHTTSALRAHFPRSPPNGASAHLRVDNARQRWLRVGAVLMVRLVVRFIGHQWLSRLRTPMSSEALHRCRVRSEDSRRWVAASTRHRSAFASRKVAALASPERRH